MKRSKVILLFAFFAISNYSFGQWSSSGNTIYTNSNNIIFNYSNNSKSTIWLNKNGSGPSSRGHYYIKAYDRWGAYLHFVGTGDGDNERLNVTFDGKVGIGTGNIYEGSLFHIENSVNGWLQTIKGSVHNKDEFIGIKMQTGYMGEYGKFAGIAAIAENLHSNLTGLSFYSSSSEKMRLTGEGELGIGTTSPSAKLHVSSMTSGDAVVKIEADIDNNNESDNPIIQFRQDGGTLGINMGFDETLFGSNIFGISRLYSENQFNDCFFIDTKNGNVSIGKKPTSVAKLDIAGTIRATEIKVEAQTADFVFSDTYTLKDLGEVENYIKTHKHLPDIPSAEEMEASGVNLAEMNKLLLQKIEELTLYVIDLEKVNKLKDNKIKSEIGEREKLEEKVSSIYSELKAIKTLLLYNQNNAK